MIPELPFSPSAERNRGPIGKALDRHLVPSARVLEFAAGTGQHACHMAALRPDVSWLATDRAEVLGGLVARIAASGLANLETPAELNLLVPATQDRIATAASRDLCFAANVLHIAPMDAVAALFGIAAHTLGSDGTLCVYGPVVIDGAHTGRGNRDFDASLRAEAAHQGLRDLAELDRYAIATGFARATLESLPANNHLMTWRRGGSPA